MMLLDHRIRIRLIKTNRRRQLVEGTSEMDAEGLQSHIS